ncbi:CPBP family intramembrane glutamic endopeptidase [[Eubacterium] cellulosolvens]
MSSIFYILIIQSGTIFAADMLYVLAWMWCPGIAALLTSILHKKNLSDFGWSLGKPNYLLLSYFLPLAYSFLTYFIVWSFRWGDLQNLDLAFFEFFAISATLGILVSSLSSLGEEIGWRGFLVPELAKVTTYTRTSIVSGVIWAVWHYPLILFADYNAGTQAWFGLSCFTVMIIGISFPLAWLRLKSGSVWTAVIFHASHNLFIQQIFDPLTEDTGVTKYFIGEFGIVLALISIPFAFIFWKKRNELTKI